MIEQVVHEDGQTLMVTYLTADFQITDEDKAELVKVRYPDGRVVFGVPVAKKEKLVKMIPANPIVGAIVDEPPAAPKRRGRLEITVHLSPQSQIAERALNRIMANRLKDMKPIVVDGLRKALFTRRKTLRIRKQDPDETTRQILDALAAEWEKVPDEVQTPLSQAILGGAATGSLQVEILDHDILAAINETALAWAAKRAAELVGMQRQEDGSLIPNPDAKWAISDSTRDSLRTVIRDVFQMDSPSMKDVEDRIVQAGIFSDTRASMIARTEISLAQTQGNLQAWKGSGKVSTVDWIISADHDQPDECDDNADASPFDIGEVPDLPAHPNCNCVIVASDISGEEE